MLRFARHGQIRSLNSLQISGGCEDMRTLTTLTPDQKIAAAVPNIFKAAHEREHERELDQQRREALRVERERAEALRHEEFLAEQQWLAQKEAEARAQMFPQRAFAIPLRDGFARAGPSGTLQ